MGTRADLVPPNGEVSAESAGQASGSRASARSTTAVQMLRLHHVSARLAMQAMLVIALVALAFLPGLNVVRLGMGLIFVLCIGVLSDRSGTLKVPGGELAIGHLRASAARKE